MRKPKNKRKVFSILLCFAMLMSLLPATVYAAQEVTYANIILDKPKAGNIPDWNAEYEGEGFTVTDIKWRENAHNGDYMDYDEPFEAGKSYLVSVIIEPTSGYVISRDQGDSHWIWYIDAYINGNYVSLMSKVGLHEMNDAWEEYLPVELITTFYVPEEITEIDRVEIEGVSIPVPGQNPQFRASTPTKGVKLTDGNYENAQNGVYWYDMDYRMDMGGNDTFVAGHRYRLIVHAETTKGYAFVDYNDWYDAYVNGKPADVDLKKNEVDVIYFFDCKNEVVESVEVDDINAPKDGSLPDYRGTIYDPAVSFKAVNNTFTQNGISWFNVTDNWSMTPNDKFEAGKEYKVSISLVPARDEYEFDVTEGFLNGKDCTVTKNGSEVILEYTFSLGLNTVSKVEVEGISAPKTGEVPSYVAIARGDMDLKDVNDTYFSGGIAWYDKTAGKYLPKRSGVFEAGHEYLVELYLVPEDGAEFDGNAKATVNGKKANIVTASKSEFYITYAFEALGEEVLTESVVLKEAGVKNITEPKAGEAPDYDAKLEGTGYVLSDDKDRDTKNGITWRNETAGKPMLVGIDKFEAGNTYSVSVMLKAEDGYVFDVDDATINGEDADVDGRDETEAILFYEFDKLPAAEVPVVPVVPETPVVPEVPVTPPAAPQKQSNFTDVKAGAYYETPVQWAVENGITSGTSETEFSPNMTCSQAHILTFLWRSVGKPATEMASPYSNPNVNEGKYYYTPFVWAWEKGMVSNVKHDPNAPCSRADVVSYLWKLEGKPDAAKASFTDVPASAEYAKQWTGQWKTASPAAQAKPHSALLIPVPAVRSYLSCTDM